MHPEWIAKSYYPSSLLEELGLETVGSRPAITRPEAWTRQGEPQPLPTTELYVAGKRSFFDRWAQELDNATIQSIDDLTHIEDFRAPSASERLRNVELSIGGEEPTEEAIYEVVLHASDAPAAEFIVAGFRDYAASLDLEPELERRLYVGGLCFIPVPGTPQAINSLADFAFLRVARPMPRLRTLTPVERSFTRPQPDRCFLPDEEAVDPSLRVAVFDGGFDRSSPLARWVESYDSSNLGAERRDYLVHGHQVTSALLFGPLEPALPAPTPYAKVDHYRVLDTTSESDPHDLYDVLRRIQEVLEQRNYDFASLSLGPALPIEDDEVHPWTAILDTYLADGQALFTVAVGNNGDQDRASGNARIQVPGDCVNGLSVGAATSTGGDWRRAPYSAVGPGRSPGLVKPDVLAFGGSAREPFYVYEPSAGLHPTGICGTSFATPAALRLALGIRAHFGDRLSPLALKALLIHSAMEHPSYERADIGWGRLPNDIEPIVTCPEGVARVVYQGTLEPARYLRATIPLPNTELAGMVAISATLCFSSETDPQDPSNYTRAGLDVVFRPHAQKFSKEDSVNAKTDSFFQLKQFSLESELRRDAHKWETVMHRTKKKRGSSLFRPVFDIHYNARDAGSFSRSADKLSYALVVTVESRQTPDLYDQVVRTYATQLEALLPIVEIPIQVRPSDGGLQA